MLHEEEADDDSHAFFGGDTTSRGTGNSSGGSGELGLGTSGGVGGLELIQSTREVRLAVLDEEPSEMERDTTGSEGTSSRGSSVSSLNSELVPGSMTSSFQIETPRKVPRRSKKKSVHFSQLNRGGGGRKGSGPRDKYGRPFGDPEKRKQWLLVGMNVLQCVALIFTSYLYVTCTSDKESQGTLSHTNKKNNDDNTNNCPAVIVDASSKELLQTVDQYLVDLTQDWETFSRDFGPPSQATLTKVTPPWDVSPMSDEMLRSTFPALAPKSPPQQYLLDINSKQVMAVYERELNLTLSTHTFCTFTDLALASFVHNVDEHGEPIQSGSKSGSGSNTKKEFALGHVHHYEREGFCKNEPIDPAEGQANGNGNGNGNSQMRSLEELVGPYATSVIAKTMRYPCTSYEEVRIAVVQELLAVMETFARATLRVDERQALIDYVKFFFSPNVEGLVRDATGDYKKYKGEEVVQQLFGRQAFIATRHRILAQEFDISVVSEIQLDNVSAENQKWFDSSYFTFRAYDSGDSANNDNETSYGPKITEVFFSFHN